MCLFLARSPGLVRKTIPAKLHLKFKMSVESPPNQVWKRYGSSESLNSGCTFGNSSHISVRRLSLTLRLAFGLALPVFFVASQRRRKAFLSEELKETGLKEGNEKDSSDCLDEEEQDRLEEVFEKCQTKIPLTPPECRSDAPPRLPRSSSSMFEYTDPKLCQTSPLDEPDSKNVHRPPRIRPASRTTTIGHLRPSGSFEIAPSSLLSTRGPLTYRGAPASSAFRKPEDRNNNNKQQQLPPKSSRPLSSSSPNNNVDGRSLFTKDPFESRRASGVRCELNGAELQLGQQHRQQKHHVVAKPAPAATSTPNDAVSGKVRSRTKFAFPKAVAAGATAAAANMAFAEEDADVSQMAMPVEAVVSSTLNESFNSVVTHSQDTTQSFADSNDPWNTAQESDQATVVENNMQTVDEDVGGSYNNVTILGGGDNTAWNTVVEEDKATDEVMEEEEEENDTFRTNDGMGTGAQGSDVVDGDGFNGGWMSTAGAVEEYGAVDSQDTLVDDDDETTPTPQDNDIQAEGGGSWGNNWGGEEGAVQDDMAEGAQAGWGADQVEGTEVAAQGWGASEDQYEQDGVEVDPVQDYEQEVEQGQQQGWGANDGFGASDDQQEQQEGWGVNDDGVFGAADEDQQQQQDVWAGQGDEIVREDEDVQQEELTIEDSAAWQTGEDFQQEGEEEELDVQTQTGWGDGVDLASEEVAEDSGNTVEPVADDSNEAYNTANEEDEDISSSMIHFGTVVGASNCDSGNNDGNSNNQEWATINQGGDSGNADDARKWSMKGHGADMVDFYQDDELSAQDPNMQLQIVKEADEEDEDKIAHHPKAMLVDRESILSMDLNSTGPTSLRSNYTDDNDCENTDNCLDEEDDDVKVMDNLSLDTDKEEEEDGAGTPKGEEEKDKQSQGAVGGAESKK